MEEFKLTPVQKQLINIAEEKGFLALEDFNAGYSSQITRKACIERFKALGLIKETSVLGKFEYIKK
uniref:Uncharacterized protein n=1 Tax=viral metagenome TaxID=1070528 RepID=A0A6M3JD90_9ZZZZ